MPNPTFSKSYRTLSMITVSLSESFELGSLIAKLNAIKKVPSRFALTFNDFANLGDTIHLKISLKSKLF